MVFRRFNDVEMHQCNQGKTVTQGEDLYIYIYKMYICICTYCSGLQAFGHTILVCVQLG